MKQYLINSAKQAKNMILDYPRFRLIRNRTHLVNAPYDIELYRAYCEKLEQKEGVVFPPFDVDEENLPEDQIRVFFRHDIDTLSCVEQLDLLLEVNKKYNHPATFHFRVDGEEYDIKDHAGKVKYCVENGFNVGLHTQCYIEDDYLEQFRRDTELFISATGISPKIFSVHGLGTYRRSVRKRFYREVGSIMPELGYHFSDCTGVQRTYNYSIEDCHFDSSSRSRYIYDDFENPDFMRKGQSYLVLTHPCYWQ